MSEEFFKKLQKLPFTNHTANFAENIILNAKKIPQKNSTLFFFSVKTGYFLALASIIIFMLGFSNIIDSELSAISSLEEIYYSNNEIL